MQNLQVSFLLLQFVKNYIIIPEKVSMNPIQINELKHGNKYIMVD